MTPAPPPSALTVAPPLHGGTSIVVCNADPAHGWALRKIATAVHGWTQSISKQTRTVKTKYRVWKARLLILL